MKRHTLTFIFVLSALLISLALWAQEKHAQYVGVKKCKMCHSNKSKGDQYGIWAASPHSKAYATLATEEAKQAAVKVEVKDNPQESPKCLKCHVTGYEAPAADKTAAYVMADGVTCETCHGPGSLYSTMLVMRALASGKQNPQEVGYNPGEKATCLKCHNEESPTYKPFDYDERFTKIAHPFKKIE